MLSTPQAVMNYDEQSVVDLAGFLAPRPASDVQITDLRQWFLMRAPNMRSDGYAVDRDKLADVPSDIPRTRPLRA